MLYLGAVAALAFALARPTMAVQVPREDATVLLTMDVSGSMRATDVSPTRMAAAQAAAEAFIAQLPPEIRVGLVSFSATTETVVAPTTDRLEIQAGIDGLTTENGTAMGDGLMETLDIAESIQTADAAAGTATPSDDPSAGPSDDEPPSPTASSGPVDEPSDQPLVAAILLSDGANTTGAAEPLEAADRAAALGVPVYTIALGTEDGEVMVPDQNGNPTPLQVPPDTETLAKIAETTGAIAFDAPTAEDLAAVYENLESRVGYTEDVQEVTAAFAGAALLLVVAAAGMSVLWFGRIP